MNNPRIELNVTIYDSLNGRYITPEDFEFIGRQLFTRGELQRINKRG